MFVQKTQEQKHENTSKRRNNIVYDVGYYVGWNFNTQLYRQSLIYINTNNKLYANGEIDMPVQKTV